MKTQAALLITAVLLTAPVASAAITMLIADDGTNLIMTATGTYTLANAALAGTASAIGLNAIVAPNVSAGIYGWEAGGGTNYLITSAIGNIYADNAAGPANLSSANIPFTIRRGFGVIGFASGPPVTGTVNNTATFNGKTVASLGMVRTESTTFTWGNGGNDETLTIIVVPEPSALVLGALGSLAFFRRKR